MTDLPTPDAPTPDELASAYLDGEATPDERARVDSDAALLARVEQLRGVRDLLAESVTVDAPRAAVRDAALSAALAEFDAGVAATARPASLPIPAYAGSVVPIPRRRSVWFGAVAAAAAVAVVVAGGFVTLRSGSSGSDDSAAFDPLGAPADTSAAEADDIPTDVATAASDPRSGGDNADDGGSGRDSAGGGSGGDNADDEGDLGGIDGPAVVDPGAMPTGPVPAFDTAEALAAYVAAAENPPTISDAPESTTADSINVTGATAAPSAPPEYGGGEPACPLEDPYIDVVYVGQATYLGVAIDLFSAVDTSVDPAVRQAVAVDSLDCHVVAAIDLD